MVRPKSVRVHRLWDFERLNTDPKDVPVPGTREFAALGSQKNVVSCESVHDLLCVGRGGAGYPSAALWAWCSHQGPCEREMGELTTARDRRTEEGAVVLSRKTENGTMVQAGSRSCERPRNRLA